MEMRNPSSSSSSEKSGKKAAVGCGNGKGVGLKKGPWTAEEDEILSSYIRREGEGKWRMLPKRAGLLRCGKSCRLRWMNYLRPSVKRGHIAADEEDLILRMHRLLGNRWSLIAGRIPGRTDNEIKNYWNTHLSKKLISLGIDPTTHKPLLLANTNKPPSSTKIPSNKPPSAGYHFPMPSSTSSCNKNVMITYDDHLQHREGKLPMMEGDDCCYDGDASYSIGQGYQDMMLMIKDYCYTRSSHENIGNEDEDDDDDAFSSFLNSLINEEAEHHHHQQQQQQVLDAKNPAAAASGSSS